MTPKFPGGNDFASIVNSATQTPGLGDKDLPDGFPLNPSGFFRTVDTAKDPEGIEGVPNWDFEAQRRVFVIYRPWDSCNRCADLIANGTLVPPEDAGDLTCPHTQLAEYKEVSDAILEGKAMHGGEQETVLRDGAVIVSIRWYPKKKRSKQKGA